MGKYDDDDDYSEFNRDGLNEIANSLESYYEMVSKFCIFPTLTKKDMKEIGDEIDKACKRLRKRKNLDKVFNMENLEAICDEDPVYRDMIYN